MKALKRIIERAIFIWDGDKTPNLLIVRIDRLFYKHAFVLPLGPAPFQQHWHIDIVIPHARWVFRQAVQAQRIFRIADICHDICAVSSKYTQNALLLADGMNILLCKAICGNQAQIHKVLGIEIVIPCIPHIRRNRRQSRIYSRSQRNNCNDGKKAAQRIAYRAKYIFNKSAHYHSILSAGMGSGFKRISVIVPLLT